MLGQLAHSMYCRITMTTQKYLTLAVLKENVELGREF